MNERILGDLDAKEHLCQNNYILNFDCAISVAEFIKRIFCTCIIDSIA